MILTKLIDLGFANLCIVSATAGHTATFSNSGEGAQTQFSYIVTGQGTVGPENNVAPLLAMTGKVTDMEHLMGSPLVGKAGDETLTWVSINPKPSNKRYDYQIISGGESVTITGTDAECALVSLLGGCTTNDKSIGEHKFARIPSGQSVDVQVPQNSVAVFLISRSGKTDE